MKQIVYLFYSVKTVAKAIEEIKVNGFDKTQKKIKVLEKTKDILQDKVNYLTVEYKNLKNEELQTISSSSNKLELEILKAKNNNLIQDKFSYDNSINEVQ